MNRFSRKQQAPHKGGEEGFTLAELMIVVAIIASIMAFVGPKIFTEFEKSKVKNTKTQIRLLMQSLETFRRDCGFYPNTDQGLPALITKPTGGRDCKNFDSEGYLSGKKVPDDAWNSPFQYVETNGKFIIKSLGADGADGGEERNSDITSDNLD